MASRRHNANRLGCVILAAGGSRRLGVPKQLVRYRTTPLLLRTLAMARAVRMERPVVVLGAEALRLRLLVRRAPGSSTVVFNADWADGLSGSLRKGLAAIPEGTAAVLVLLADQPFVTRTSLQRLIGAWRRQPAKPAAAAYEGGLGVPAIIPRRWWPMLRALKGDVGARRVLMAAGCTTAVSMPEAVIDVDRPADLARLRRGRPLRS